MEKDAHTIALKKEEVKDIIHTIIEKISKNNFFSAEEMQDYSEKLSNYLNTLLEKIDEKDSFDFKILTDPHEYSEMIKEHKDIVNYKDDYDKIDYVKDTVCVENVIGDSKIEKVYNYYSDVYTSTTDFSLQDLQVSIMKHSSYNGYERNFDFVRTNVKSRLYEILVYIPKERDEREDSVKTYQELLHNENFQKTRDIFQQKTEELIEKVLIQISSNCDLSDSLINEYKIKLQEFFKVTDDDIEKMMADSYLSNRDFISTVKRDPYKYVESCKDTYALHQPLINNIIGDFHSDSKNFKSSADFSIGNIQICSKTDENCQSINRFDTELLIYVPDETFCKKYAKKGIQTYKELLESDRVEEHIKAKDLAQKARDNFVISIKDKTNNSLTQEQIDIILNNIDFNIELIKIIGDVSTYNIDVTGNPDEFSKALDTDTENIIGNSINGFFYRYPYETEIIGKLPNFSLDQLQVVNHNYSNIFIYMPEQEYAEKDYKELAEQTIRKKLTEQLKEKANGKLSDEDIDNIIKGMGEDILNDTKIEILSDPFEYANQIIIENEEIRNICGDMIFGKSEKINIEVEFYGSFKQQITTIPNFSLKSLQASSMNKYTDDAFDDRAKVKTGRVLTIYIPEKEYEEKDYKELIHNKKRDEITAIIMQQTNNSICIEKVAEIADVLADKVDADKEFSILSSPYEYADFIYQSNDDSKTIESTQILGDMENYNFSLNMLQVRKIQKFIYNCDELDYNLFEQYAIYIPNEKYIDGATFDDLSDLDYKLQEARRLLERYKNDEYFQENPEYVHNNEIQQELAKLIAQRNNFIVDKGENDSYEK